ncbi:MAG: hypothetical protein KJO07_18425, partial [Deltaproteobacteria bacterium]|nr:hypothetical protein [Deltaproteobacteria bacterium]
MKRLAYLVLFGALTVNVAACGDDDDLGGGADAGDGVDGDVEPTVGSCGVNVFSALLRNGNGGGPNLAGVPVVFNAPNGQLLGAAVTDVKGAASIDNCVRGTSITFVINRDVYDCRVCGQDCRACGEGIPGPIPFPGPGNRYDIYTYAGANPGDTFYYSADYDEGSPPLYADLNVILSRDLSGFPIAEGSYTMDLQVGDCSSGIDFGAESIPDPLNIYRSNLSSSCVGETRSDVDLIVWLSGSSSSGFDPFEQDDMDNAYAFLKDVPITEGTNLETFVNEATTGAWMGLHKDNVHTVFNPLSAGYVSGRARHYVDGVQMGGSASQGVDYDQEDGEIPPPASADDWRGLPMG